MKFSNSLVNIDTDESPTTITINDRVRTIDFFVRERLRKSWLGTSVRFIIPQSVIEIESNAFSNFSNTIEELIIPNNVKSIDRKAFDTCTGLKKIVIPKSISKHLAEKFDVDFIRYDTNAEVVVRNQNNSYNSNLDTSDSDSYKKSNNSSLKSYCGFVRENLINKKK